MSAVFNYWSQVFSLGREVLTVSNCWELPSSCSREKEQLEGQCCCWLRGCRRTRPVKEEWRKGLKKTFLSAFITKYWPVMMFAGHCWGFLWMLEVNPAWLCHLSKIILDCKIMCSCTVHVNSVFVRPVPSEGTCRVCRNQSNCSDPAQLGVTFSGCMNPLKLECLGREEGEPSLCPAAQGITASQGCGRS